MARATEKRLKEIQEWQLANPEKRSATQHRWRKKNPHYMRQWRYRLSADEYERYLIAQDHRCGICGNEFQLEGRSMAPSVDHSHATGKVRGLLCPRCNIGLQFIEDVAFMRSAEKYLEGNNQ